MFSLEERKKSIKLVAKLGLEQASALVGIPKKRMKRWVENGPDRKKGAGRKTMDPEMEYKLICWISYFTEKNKRFPMRQVIKQKAKELTCIREFRASKGWCDKFFRRNAVIINRMKEFVINENKGNFFRNLVHNKLLQNEAGFD